ncbi:DUF58 domain-containing protein [Sphingomonas sp. BT-65]|uniref:DUF58 domain-containing protein n=1 Tax=Sphingomonas sp. BT-65 TaxID=2989821 RepID=UPI00223676C6|nr:DUF58 domain-containing protein [Sphingomonas sp. BT-65]MCW4460090.1 DUF58 domain-containing protein [Sphingomonas sp. BT-65]
MIVPTQRAVALVLAAAPLALVLGVVRPDGWLFALFWVFAILVLTFLDGALAPRLRDADLATAFPGSVEVGDKVELVPAGGPALRYAAEVSAPLDPAAAPLRYAASRRGTAKVARIWARVAGPLGLAWRQRSRAEDGEVRVLPSLRPVREQGMRQFLRSRQFGTRIRPDSGDGTEFQSLTDFQPGMERRAIDWKASARHFSLLAREFRTERDNSVVFAIDCGRAMSEPVDGLPRIDRAVSAALLAAFVALKSGDQVRLFGFAGRPSADSGSVSGSSGFATLHRTAAAIDYGAEESNFTLSLVTLDQRLQRRSLVILFTEFTDPTSAELMISAAARMLKRHRVLFVLFHDTELDAILDARPEQVDDVIRVNIAHTLIRERRIVIERLKRLGIDVLEANPDDLALTLAERYVRDRERP